MATRLFQIHLLCLILCIVAGCDPEQWPVDAADGSVSDADLPPPARADGGDARAGRGGSTAAGRGGTGAAASGGQAAGSSGSQAGKGGTGTGTTGGDAGKGGAVGEAGKGGSPSDAGKGGGPATAGKGGSGGAAAGRGGSPAAGSGGTGPGGKRCGTRGGVQCGAKQFCNFEPDADCGGTDRGGVCEDKSESCPDIYEPVCGCDNHTYSSDCVAHSAGVSVKRDGLCNPDECDAAGGRVVTSNGANIPECKADESSWNISGGKEQVICCLKTTVAGRTCGGIAALECDPKQFCNYEKAAGGQGCDGTIADAAGRCQPIPGGACTRDYRPVCSCDRKSYSNACEAHADGASIMHDGACTENDCKARGGRVAPGLGPPAMCNANEHEHGFVVSNDGSMPIEGALCCLP